MEQPWWDIFWVYGDSDGTTYRNLSGETDDNQLDLCDLSMLITQFMANLRRKLMTNIDKLWTFGVVPWILRHLAWFSRWGQIFMITSSQLLAPSGDHGNSWEYHAIDHHKMRIQWTKMGIYTILPVISCNGLEHPCATFEEAFKHLQNLDT
jgi:hypothetical protein